MPYFTLVNFDENEWWVIAGFFLLLSLFLLVPRHFPPVLTFLLLLFNAQLAISVDIILGSSFPFNFYDALDTEKYEFFDFIMDSFNYTLIGYFFMYCYDKWKLRRFLWVFHFLTWIGVSLLLEWISHQLHVYHYHNWHLGYSAVAYFLIFIVYIIYLKIGKLAYQYFRETKSMKN
ncbi:hypothetical protein HW35_01995 [Bacillus sp. X1(2014)]|nr:hypothetical protein HW35_01995 [Bacillus sp. X1(2014)]